MAGGAMARVRPQVIAEMAAAWHPAAAGMAAVKRLAALAKAANRMVEKGPRPEAVAHRRVMEGPRPEVVVQAEEELPVEEESH